MEGGQFLNFIGGTTVTRGDIELMGVPQSSRTGENPVNFCAEFIFTSYFPLERFFYNFSPNWEKFTRSRTVFLDLGKTSRLGGNLLIGVLYLPLV